MEDGAAARQPADAPRRPKLTRLKIESFRGVEPCELRFRDGFNVLLGLNATGKTTLLELIAAAVSFDFSRFKNEAFAVEYDVELSTGVIHASIRNVRTTQREPSSAFAAIGPSPSSDVYVPSADLRIRFADPPEEWTVHADMSSVWRGDAPENKIPLRTLMRERGSDLLIRALQLVAHPGLSLERRNELEACTRVRRFDEALDIFREITSPSTYIDGWIALAQRTVGGLSAGGLVPMDLFLAMHARMPEISDGSQGATIPSESLGFLREASTLFGFHAARLEMRLEGKTRDQTIEQMRFSDFRFMFEDPDGSVVRHEDLSYGQKRLLAFYYYLAASPSTVIADELVDGLHHLWISASIDAIHDRQAFLASQNPLLLDHLEFESAEQVASTFVVCRAERKANRKRMSWSNMSTYDAERFYRAYRVDVEHVSEILISKGLW